jgi:hypothetical protein
VTNSIRFPCAGFLLLAQLALGSGSDTYGVPGYLDVATFTINDYMSPTADLARSHAEGDRLFGQLQSRLSSKYPSISCRRSFNERDASVTKANYIAANSNNSEFVFFCGHGGPTGQKTHDNQFVHNNDKSYGGWTRWPILINCLGLNNKDVGHYTPMFNGAHALFGYESNSVEFMQRYNCNIFNADCSYRRSEDAWNYFTDNWVNKGMFMYDAYVESVRTVIYSGGGYGVAPGAVYCYGNVNGVWFIGGTEKVTNVFNGDVSYASLNKVHRYEKYGTPTY